MDDTTIGAITNALAVLGLLSITYGKFIGPRQTRLVQAVIDGKQIESRYRPAVNFVTGVGLAVALSAFLAVWLGSWEVLIIGVVAGVFASEEAASTHDDASNQLATVFSTEQTNGTTTSKTTSAGLPLEMAVDDK
jgi:hypothetical protein